MHEPKDHTPEPGSSTPIASAGARLSPIQEAYGRYAQHFNQCTDCRDIDRRCSDGARLWKAYETLGNQAYKQLADETP